MVVWEGKYEGGGTQKLENILSCAFQTLFWVKMHITNTSDTTSNFGEFFKSAR